MVDMELEKQGFGERDVTNIGFSEKLEFLSFQGPFLMISDGFGTDFMIFATVEKC